MATPKKPKALEDNVSVRPCNYRDGAYFCVKTAVYDGNVIRHHVGNVDLVDRRTGRVTLSHYMRSTQPLTAPVIIGPAR